MTGKTQVVPSTPCRAYTIRGHLPDFNTSQRLSYENTQSRLSDRQPHLPDPNNLTDGYIYVDYAHMNNAADDMVQQTRAISTTLTNLEMELTALRDSWIGDDREQYDAKQKAWNNAVKAMEQLLINNSGLLTEVSANYQYSAGSLAQMWSCVRIGR
jgi:WXG100 family type VII secretion target